MSVDKNHLRLKFRVFGQASHFGRLGDRRRLSLGDVPIVEQPKQSIEISSNNSGSWIKMEHEPDSIQIKDCEENGS